MVNLFFPLKKVSIQLSNSIVTLKFSYHKQQKYFLGCKRSNINPISTICTQSETTPVISLKDNALNEGKVLTEVEHSSKTLMLLWIHAYNERKDNFIKILRKLPHY